MTILNFLFYLYLSLLQAGDTDLTLVPFSKFLQVNTSWFHSSLLTENQSIMTCESNLILSFSFSSNLTFQHHNETAPGGPPLSVKAEMLDARTVNVTWKVRDT